MAAAEYYAGGGGNGSNLPPQAQAPPPRPQYPLHAQSQQNISPLPYPISDDPPPYSTLMSDPRPHSQPPPQNRPPMSTPQHSQYQYRPQRDDTHMYPPEKQAHFNNMQQNGYIPPGDYRPPQGRQSSYQQPQGQQGYPFPHGAPPPVQKPHGGPDRRTNTPAYPSKSDHRHDSSTSRSRSRSRDRNRRKHRRHHHEDRPEYYERLRDSYERPREQKKKSNGVSTFLGAGSGAVIGDLLFPGLGTIGGALLGGVGGHEYGKQRRSYSNDRDYYEDNHRRGRRHEGKY